MGRKFFVFIIFSLLMMKTHIFSFCLLISLYSNTDQKNSWFTFPESCAADGINDSVMSPPNKIESVSGMRRNKIDQGFSLCYM